MTTSTKRPTKISQTSGSYASGKYYRTWSNLSNLKYESNFADCGTGSSNSTLIGGKNGSYPRPAPLKLTNFGFSIPSTAKISKITVYYRHYKPKIKGAYPTFTAPTIDLLNVSASAKKGSAVPTSSTEYSVSWSMSPSVSKVNSSSFGVSINYPANSSTNPGQLRLRNVRIVVTYTNAVAVANVNLDNSGSSYVGATNGSSVIVANGGSSNNLNVSQTNANVSKSKVYYGETVDITLTISASSKITAPARMCLTIPEDVEVIGKKSGNGTIDDSIVNDYQGYENYHWDANFSNSTSVSITFTVQINSIGTLLFEFREVTTDKSSTVKIIGEIPPSIVFWGDTNSTTAMEEPIEIIITYFSFSTVPFEKTFDVTFPQGVTVNWDDAEGVVQNNNVYTLTKTLNENENYFKCTLSFANIADIGKYQINLEDDADNTLSRTIIVKPSNLTLPYFCKIVADEHVRDRLGNSKEYTLSSLMKLVVDSENADLIEAYDYNYRLGVFNTNFPENPDPVNFINLIDTHYWRELEGRSTQVFIEDDGIKGISVCTFGLNTEFTNSNYYTLTFDLETTFNNRVGFLLFGDPSGTMTNKYSWYGIITDINRTFLEVYDADGTPFKLYTAPKNFFQEENNTIKITREGNSALIYINDELFYNLNDISGSYNTIGFQKWGQGAVKISNINLDLDMENIDYYLLENAEWSDPISTPNAWEDIKVNFFYSDRYPLIFLITGEYIEANAEEINIKYTYPTLIEEDYRQFAENPGVYEYPIKNIITDENVTSLNLQLGEVTNIAKLYDIDFTNFLEGDDDNRIIQGVTVYFDVLTCDNPISIMCKLVSPSFSKEGNRSLNIESVFLEEDNFQGIVSLGGQFDLWGLDWDDFKLSKLEDLEIDLQFLNNFNRAAHIEFNNLRIVFHYVELEEAKIISKVNGVDLRYFNVFIKDAIIKPGSNYDVQYLDVEGTDSNLAYRSNLREKEIEIEIRVPGCDIEETTTFVERLARLLTTKRDKFNKPILNEIEFSHHPNRIWEYILEDELDVSAEFTEYEGKIKLVVPSGTAYSKEPTITNATGTNGGIAKVNPIIRVIAQPDENDHTIIVKETISNQEWRLTDDSLEIGDILRIDCGERKAYKVEGQDDDYYENDSDGSPDIDITDKVDFNSDWFLIQDDYNFECENTAIIQSVTFYERW
ncbi:hypothetical protein [Methanobrevibacter sp.]|uniref:hypothetical protein n=1 Tax=Methanobrevibacter sp. TaxID=66852 RepID=UPI00386630CE